MMVLETYLMFTHRTYDNLVSTPNISYVCRAQTICVCAVHFALDIWYSEIWNYRANILDWTVIARACKKMQNKPPMYYKPSRIFAEQTKPSANRPACIKWYWDVVMIHINFVRALVGNSNFWFQFLGPPLEANFQFRFRFRRFRSEYFLDCGLDLRSNPRPKV